MLEGTQRQHTSAASGDAESKGKRRAAQARAVAEQGFVTRLFLTSAAPMSGLFEWRMAVSDLETKTSAGRGK